MNNNRQPITFYFLILMIGWTLTIIGLGLWSYNTMYDETVTLAKREAYKAYEKDVMVRYWATIHGGVYVPSGTITPPNPDLEFLPERDIETPSGKKLTLMNPAYITRQLLEISEQRLGIKGHITSLNPLRAANEADPWEKIALKEIEAGAREYYAIDTLSGEEYFRYMAPLVTEKGCLKCHAKQGYQVGDIRGGISSSVPWSFYRQSLNASVSNHLIGYGILWLLGFAGLGLVRKKFLFYIRGRDESDVEMQRLVEELRQSKGVVEENLKAREALVIELTETKKHLERINSEKDKFFSIIAHDLRAPFQGFLGLTEELASAVNSLSQEEYALYGKSMHDSAANIYSLLENLLEWSKIQRGLVEFKPVKTDLAASVYSILNLFEARSVQKKITLNVAIEPDVSPFVDGNVLNTVLRNLISNALKFTPRGGKIEISAEGHGKTVSISVKDNGVGMSPEFVEKLFKISEKVSREGTEGESSSGLGLVLCSELIKKSGGTISPALNEWKDNSPFGGMTFTVTLPVSNIEE